MLANKLMSVGNPRLVSNLGGKTFSGSATTVTDTGFSLGAAQSDRVIVITVAASAGSARQISGVTIGGSAATLAILSASSSYCTGIYYLAVPSGATADIVYTFTGAITNMASNVYALTGWGSVTLYDSNTAIGTSFNLATASDLDTASGGLLVAAAAGVGIADPYFNSTPTLTQDRLYKNEMSNCLLGSKWPSSAATGTSVSFHTDTSGSSKTLCAAAFS